MENITMKKNNFENIAWKENLYVCGIDEAGRGALHGPLVIGAVILPKNTNYPILKDSKTISENERNKAYDWIKKNAFFSSLYVDARTVDKKNIYQATRFAMKKVFLQMLEIFPQKSLIKFLVTDAVPIKKNFSGSLNLSNETLEFYNPTHAESISASVAAASIVAKVTRDRIMNKFSKIFPGFKLAQHKGYGTKTHLAEIKKRGASILHRQSFLKNIAAEIIGSKQTKLFVSSPPKAGI
jgi:ribonuclease HII